MKLPIPANIITGGLGSGKTTLISFLMENKSLSRYKDERWAVLVNEFGSLGIDGSLIEGATSASGQGKP